MSHWKDPRICVMCGLKYIPLAARQKTCGEICSRSYKLEQEKLKYRSVSPKNCVVCKEIFQADRRAKTCSAECSHKWRNRRIGRKYPPKNCVVCKKLFYGSPRSITCSSECSYQSKLERARLGLYSKDRPPIPCPTCGELFKPKTLSHRFCSRNCWESNPRKPARVVNCLQCGDEFTTTRSHQKYCGPQCATEANKIRLSRFNADIRKSRQKQIVKCKSCNFHFEQKNSRHTFCSATCNAEYYREKGLRDTDNSPIRPKTCFYCKEEFTPKTRQSRAKFCSSKCRGGHQNAKRQEKINEREKEQVNQVELQRKWDDSSVEVRDCPPDTAYAKEIWAYLKKGKTITKYLHPIWAAGAVIDEDEVELFEI